MIAIIKYNTGRTTISGVFSTMQGLLKIGLRGISNASIEIYKDNTMIGKPIKTINK